ncbi:hypothetical protein V7161_25235 [Neobacillus drentensis]|uniref:hypothetical protein n=1 Tax=Neobacillus drentensis TaxID=220684 RepID=UPI0030035EF3
MRKWVIVIMLMCLFLSINTTSQAAIDGVRLVDYPRNSILYQSLTSNNSLDQLNQIIVLQKSLLIKKKQLQ